MPLVLNRAEKVFGQEGKATHGLEGIVKAEAIFTAGVGDADNVGGNIQRTVGTDKVNTIVLIQQFLKERVTIPTGHQASRNLSR